MLRSDKDNIKMVVSEAWNERIEKARQVKLQHLREQKSDIVAKMLDDEVFRGVMQEGINTFGPRVFGLSAKSLTASSAAGMLECMFRGFDTPRRYSGTKPKAGDWDDAPTLLKAAKDLGYFDAEAFETEEYVPMYRRTSYVTLDIALNNSKSSMKDLVTGLITLASDMAEVNTADEWDAAVMRFTLSIGK